MQLTAEKRPQPFHYFCKTTQNLDQLELREQRAVNGTFAVCPFIFCQLYTMHGVVMDNSTIGVFFDEKWKWIKIRKVCSFRDFERFARSTRNSHLLRNRCHWKSSIQNANIKDCFFHFAQANWRKTAKTQNSSVAIALIPNKDIFLALKYIKKQMQGYLSLSRDASWSASQNIKVTRMYNLVQETLSLVRLEVHVFYGHTNSLENYSKPVTVNQSPFRVVNLVRCKLNLISFEEIRNRQVKFGVAGSLSRQTSEVT